MSIGYVRVTAQCLTGSRRRRRCPTASVTQGADKAILEKACHTYLTHCPARLPESVNTQPLRGT